MHLNMGLAFEVSFAALGRSHSVATIPHVMDKIKDTLACLKPDQIHVITAVKPIYAVPRHVQWQWTEQSVKTSLLSCLGAYTLKWLL